MTMWFEIPAMLEVQPDEELARMKAVCKGWCAKNARGPAKELEDAVRMLDMIRTEQRRRLQSATVVKAALQ